MFGYKLKQDREQRGWSQEYLVKQIHVSRQSISKWETGKNYPSIEVIIHLSDIFGITVDELLRSDETLQEKVIQDSKPSHHWSTYVLFGLGILIGIILVSIIKNDKFYWEALMKPVSITVLLAVSVFCIYKGKQAVMQRS